MQGILKYLENFADSVTNLIDFFLNCFKDVVYVAELLIKIATHLPDYFSWLPAECLTIVLLIFSIVIIYKLLGREG